MMRDKNFPKSKAVTAYGLLSEIRALILSEPLRYNQEWWLSRKGMEHQNYEEPARGYPSCGTVGCVAGWVASLSRRNIADAFDAEDVAIDVLGLNFCDPEELFDGSVVRGVPQTKAHAKAGAAHIAAFQKKYRAELLANKITVAK